MNQEESSKFSNPWQDDYEQQIDKYSKYMSGLLNGSILMSPESREQVDDMLFEAIWSRIAVKRDEEFLKELELVVRDSKDFLIEELRIEEEQYKKATQVRNATQDVIDAIERKVNEHDDDERNAIIQFFELLSKRLNQE